MSNVSTGSQNHARAIALLDGLAGRGLRDVCLSPGSRNTPLSLAAIAHPDLRIRVVHDERVAGFMAVGMAKATHTPAAVICTSGTAAAEYLPAVTEATQSDTPLIVLTADRPPELRGVGAPQTIDQIELYGSRAVWFCDAPLPTAATDAAFVSLGHQAWEAATERRGAAHLNLPFAEPLMGTAGTTAGANHADPRPAQETEPPSKAELDTIMSALDGRKALFVVGRCRDPNGAIAALASQCGAPVIADPQTTSRSGPSAATIRSGDLLSRNGALDMLRPDVVVRWGALPTSKSVWSWLEQSGVPQIMISHADRGDPLRSASRKLTGSPATVATQLFDRSIAPAAGYLDSWCDLDRRASTAALQAIEATPFPNEPSIAATVMRATDVSATVFAGSSMPIRDIDAFGLAPHATVIGNRGAAGIDGSIATALGAANHGPVVALIGDVAALHDLGGLSQLARTNVDLTVIIVHNDGGGIFSFLPQAQPAMVAPDVFETAFGTPHGTDFVAVSQALGLKASTVETVDDLNSRIRSGGKQIIVLHTDRHANRTHHERIDEAVRAALATEPSAD